MTPIKQREAAVAAITTLQAELMSPALTMPSAAELRERLVEKIDSLQAEAVDRATADLHALANEAPLELFGSDRYQHGSVPDADDAIATARLWLAFAAGKDAILAKFDPLIEAMTLGKDPEARAARIADIQRQIVAAELAEEAAILAMEAEGVEWRPRPGQRPEIAILLEAV